MKRLKRLILLFCLAVCAPLAFVIVHTYQSLAQEERAQLRFFSETLFDEIEKEMADLVQREENRAVDEYNYTLADDTSQGRKSPIAKPPGENYILGYLQNNPDGSFATPLVADPGRVPQDLRQTIAQLRQANTLFNSKKFAMPQKPTPPPPVLEESEAAQDQKEKAIFADRYIAKSQQKFSKSFLGRQTSRKQEITAGQALNLAREDQAIVRLEKDAAGISAQGEEAKRAAMPAEPAHQKGPDLSGTAIQPPVAPAADGNFAFQVEVAPLQSLFISDGRFYIFRRIAINNQIFRQGFILLVEPYLRHLAAAHFDNQPMAAFTRLTLEVVETGVKTAGVHNGFQDANNDFITARTFPAPFDFIQAAVHAAQVPPSPTRRNLNISLAALGVIMLIGLVAIYQSARTVVDLSERRSQFVSSVTHELKTPLTNIRMYIEMLEQGIAATPEREQEYLQILESESARLSRLINNVLELARLEKKQRRFDLRPARIDDLFAEIRTIMGRKLSQEGFELNIEIGQLPGFAFDREVLIQILINLIENSMKFGHAAPNKSIDLSAVHEGDMVKISVADHGPGIPRQSLKKVFDDFYRVQNELTRQAGGTGIGLALVKKFVNAMGGRVQAENNNGPGCTITIFLPCPAQGPGQ